MDGQLLDANEVLAIGYTGGNCNAVALLEVPGRSAVAEGWADVFDLEPDVTRTVKRVSGIRCLSHVKRYGALMLHSDIGRECYARSSCYVKSCTSSSLAAYIATEDI